MKYFRNVQEKKMNTPQMLCLLRTSTKVFVSRWVSRYIIVHLETSLDQSLLILIKTLGATGSARMLCLQPCDFSLSHLIDYAVHLTRAQYENT